MHAYFDVHFFSLTTFFMLTRFSDTWVCGISHTLLPRECGDQLLYTTVSVYVCNLQQEKEQAALCVCNTTQPLSVQAPRE